MHPIWKMYVDFVSGQPGVRFLDVSSAPEILFWVCLLGYGVLSGALFFRSVPCGMPGMLWRLSSVGVVLLASAGFAITKCRWEMRDMVASFGAGDPVSTQIIPVLPVFLPAMLLCAVYLVLLRWKRRRR